MPTCADLIWAHDLHPLTDGAGAGLPAVGHAAAAVVLAGVGDARLDGHLAKLARETLRTQADGALAGPVLLTHAAVLTAVLRPRAQRTCRTGRARG